MYIRHLLTQTRVLFTAAVAAYTTSGGTKRETHYYYCCYCMCTYKTAVLFGVTGPPFVVRRSRSFFLKGVACIGG